MATMRPMIRKMLNRSAAATMLALKIV